MITPVPLGGKYIIVASDDRPDNNARVMGPILTVDEKQPIQEVELRFVEGVTLAVRVNDDAGQPLPGVDVSLHYSSAHNHGFGGPTHKTDRLGRYRFQHVNAGLPGEYHLDIRPAARFQGRRVPARFNDKPIVVRLQPGLSAAGVLIDDASGWPIPDAVVSAYPAEYRAAGYHGVIKTRTNQRGEFRFDNLEDIRYRLRVKGAVTASTVIRRNPDGTTSYVRSGQHQDTFVTGGQSEVTAMRVKLKPNSRLRPNRSGK